MEFINSYNVCFLGRTGNGKSSLLNALWGTNFTTDPLVSCTKELYSVTIMGFIGEGYEAVTIYDTPGIGEFSSDSKYEKYYRHAIGLADCIVLVSTFDRTDAPAQRLLMRMKNYMDVSKNVRFLVALNHIDSRIITDTDGKYEPWDEILNVPTKQCMKNIEDRIAILHTKFDGKFLPFKVIPVCAIRNYGIQELKEAIINF